MSDEVAVYMARCDECEVYAEVGDVNVDAELEPTSVVLSCGHEMPLTFEEGDDGAD